MSARAGGDRGSATVWVLALSGVLAVVGLAAVLVGAAVVARHRASSAADLSALAAAGRAVVGGDACGGAAEIAGAHEAELTACVVGAGSIVDVEVSVTVRLGTWGIFSTTARARAGPVASPGIVLATEVSGPRGQQSPLERRAIDQKTRSSSVSSTGSSTTLAAAFRETWRGSSAVSGEGDPTSTALASSSSTTSNTRTAPALSSGSLPLPHFGDCTHDGQPLSHSQLATVARVACSHWRSTP
jgi:secretion/DNA translocation related TadE-like protein